MKQSPAMPYYLKSSLYIAFIALIVLFLASILTHGHNWGGDFSQYIMQAKAILAGDIHTLQMQLETIIEKSDYKGWPLLYPWGYPLLLTPFAAFGNEDIFILKLSGASLFVLFLITLWIGFKRNHTRFFRFCLLGIFLLSPAVLSLVDKVLSDIPFLFFSVLAIFAIRRITLDKKIILNRFSDNMILGLLIAFAFFIRANGILILASLAMIHLVMIKQTRQVEWIHIYHNLKIPLESIPYLGFLTAFALWSSIFPGGGSSYLEMFSGMTKEFFIHNLKYYAQLPAELIASAPFYLSLHAMSLPFFILGVIQRFKQDYFIVTYMALTIAILVAWPFNQGLRFILPILPFYWSFVISGLASMQGGASRVECAYRHILAGAPLVFILYYSLNASAITAKENLENYKGIDSGPYTRPATEMFDYIRNNTDIDDKMVFFKPRVMLLQTGRIGFIAFSGESIKENKGDYLVLHKGIGSYHQVDPNIALQQNIGIPVFHNSHFLVFKLN